MVMAEKLNESDEKRRDEPFAHVLTSLLRVHYNGEIILPRFGWTAFNRAIRYVWLL